MKRILPQVLAAVTALALAGCSAKHYRHSADKEAGRLLQEKSRQVRNAGTNFDVAQIHAVELRQLPTRLEIPTFLGTEGTNEAGATMLSLKESLRLAVRHSRTYQSRKEQLYLSALSLALARHQWTPIFSGNSAVKVAAQVDELAGTETGSTSDNLVEKQQVSATGTINANWLLRDAGLLTASVTTDFLRFLIGDPRTVTSSRAAATFTRPLLRNAGYRQQMENLTLAERSLLYELRDFSQFRKDFSVQVATAYYRVLGQRDAVKNSFLNLQSSKRNAERTRRLAEEGRVSQADHGRLEQQKLDAQNTYIGALREYKESLNNFKLQQLGLPVKLNLVLDDQELEQLAIKHPAIDIEDSIKIAFASRLDLMNALNRHEDAVRNVELTRNFLRPQLDLVASGGLGSGTRPGGGLALPDPQRYQWSAGLDVNLPFDRKTERNAYCGAIIAEKRAARDVEQKTDQIRLDVIESWRTLEQAKGSYEISELGVKIAERRAREQELLAELGRANALDQVDSQNALNASKNQRTQALVTHNISRLQFWINMGILYIKDNGQWDDGGKMGASR